MAPGMLFKAEAQLPGMRKYTLLDGYTATNGYVIQQDARGYIWLGTENGAMRFDGKKFQIFRDELRPADQEILSCNPYGKDKVLFVPLLNNIAWYSNGEVFSGRRDPRLNCIRNSGKNNAFTDAFTGYLWLSDESKFGTLYRFSDQLIIRFDAPDPLFNIIAVRKNQFIVLDPTRAVRRYDMTTRRYRTLYNNNREPVVCAGYVETIQDGRYLFSYTPQLDRLDIYTFPNDSTLELVKTIPQPVPGKVWRVFSNRGQDLWSGFREGGVAYLAQRENAPPSCFHFMDKTVINYLFTDREQNIWMSARNNSLYFLSRKHFRNALWAHQLLPGNSIPRCISGDGQGNVAMSYVDEAQLVIRSGGKNRSFPLNDHFYEGPREICPLGTNRFLILDKGLALVNGTKGAVQYFDMEPISYKDMFLYRDGGLLLASQSRIVYLDSLDVTTGRLRKKPLLVFDGRASAVASLADGAVLIGTPDGLLIKKNLAAAASRITHPVLSHINITDIAGNGSNGALIATNAQGIYFYNAANGQVKSIDVFPGNSNMLVRRIFRQNDSLYWLATGNGACEVTFDHAFNVKRVRNYTFYDGLPSNNITSIYADQDTAFISTAEGAGIIPLRDTTLLRMAPPQIYLNSVSLRDSLVTHPSSLTLSYRKNDFLISLSAISYESFGNIKYRYRLEGLSGEWTETDNPEIRFTGLAPGDYLFKAYAFNAKGTRSIYPVMLEVRILPAFWQTLFFKAGSITLALLLLYFLLRHRAIRSTLKKYEKARLQRRLAELELEAIKAQINPHFIYNCLNSIQYFNYEQQHENSRQYLDLFARLIRRTMQYSRQTFISVAEEADYLDNYLELEQMRFREKLKYDLVMASGLDRGQLMPSMMIQPYVENALKHGIAGRSSGGYVTIRFEQAGGNLVVRIEDNGPGFSEHSRDDTLSLGLRLSGSRAETYNQLFGMKIETSIENKEDTGLHQSGIIVQLKIPPVPDEHPYL